MKNGAKILLVEDDKENCLMLKEVLTNWGYAVTEAFSGEEAVQHGQKEPFDVVLSDIRMARMDGLQVLKSLRKSQPETPVIMMTGFGSMESAAEAIKAGAFDYVSKPFKIDEIKQTLSRALEDRQAKAANAAATPAAETAMDLVGHSKAMAEVYKTIAQVAQGKSTVLILGESGTGKELVARAIHKHSDRASKPFVAIGCPNFPEQLLESELFGYSRGAHSTATSDKPGLFETAAGGTLLLDEIGDMGLALQAKLLRVLEDSETRRLGDTRSTKTDVRIIASTNQDIPARIREGKFREDLYYRLNVVTIALPPLRARKEDIPYLAAHFIKKYNLISHKNVVDVAPEVLEAFQRYSWPGNVRELENVIERSVILNRKSTIVLEDIDKSILAPTPPPSAVSLEVMEKRHIEQVLRETNGNMKAAAERLGIDRKTLYRKAAKYGIHVVRE